MCEIQEPWEVYLDAEKYEYTRNRRFEREERDEDDYPDPWEDGCYE